MEKWVWEKCNRVWKGEGWPEEWKEGVIVPIVKKGEGESGGVQGGVTLMPTLYKIYTTVLAGKCLRKELEEPHNQRVSEGDGGNR